MVVSKEPVFVKGIWGPYEGHVIPGFWMSEGGQTATGRQFLVFNLLQYISDPLLYGTSQGISIDNS